MYRFTFNFNKLSVQLVISFLVVVLLTAALVGLPAILLLKNQLEHQAWVQVDQAEQTAISLYEKKALELENAANLTSQRPTLKTLLEQNDPQALEEYLLTLQTGANLDLINICQSQNIIAGTRNQIAVCSEDLSQQFYLEGGSIWLVARSELTDPEPGVVVVGILLDDDFAVEIRDQIGLDQALIHQDQILSSSFRFEGDQVQNLQDCLGEQDSQEAQVICSAGNAVYYFTVSPLSEKEFSVAVALDISEIAAAENRLIRWMLAAMVGIAGVVTLLGVMLSRRISHPLVKLSRSAAAFSQGDLDTPVATESNLIEISRVARALDHARMDLQGMLKSLENERDWSENLLDSIIEGIITLNREGRITFFSHGAERLTGRLAVEVLDSHINDVLPLVDSSAPLYSLLSSSSEEGYQKVDVALADQLTTSLAITSARLTRSGVAEEEIALVIRDISEEEAVHRLLGHFLANVSHELRTPLTALEASIEMLLDPAGILTPEERKNLYISLHLGIFRLHTLFDNLLEGANIEARRFHISPRLTDLAPIVAEAVQTMQPLLFKYDQSLSVEIPLDPPRVVADRRRIVQVLVNLISNANKYGPPGAEISLEVSEIPGAVRLDVKDQGPGIPAHMRDNLFGRFVFPQEGTEISQAGTGLGLSVVKAIIEAHGGEVGVEDCPGGGAQFWFTLPIDSEDE